MGIWRDLKLIVQEVGVIHYRMSLIVKRKDLFEYLIDKFCMIYMNVMFWLKQYYVVPHRKLLI